MNDKFRILMQSVDDDLLEEAMQPVSRKSILRWVIPEGLVQKNVNV